MAIHSSILGWEVPWTEKTGELQSLGSAKESDTTSQLNSNNNQYFHLQSLRKSDKYSASYWK